MLVYFKLKMFSKTQQAEINNNLNRIIKNLSVIGFTCTKYR